EMLLNSSLSFTRPQDKLWSGTFDDNSFFQFRYDCLLRKRKYQEFTHKGYLGSRVDILPHQASVFYESTKGLSARVILSDEVGLGKTIEAGLILKNLVQRKLVQTALIIVPDSLVFQWFVEM